MFWPTPECNGLNPGFGSVLHRSDYADSERGGVALQHDANAVQSTPVAHLHAETMACILETM